MLTVRNAACLSASFGARLAAASNCERRLFWARSPNENARVKGIRGGVRCVETGMAMNARRLNQQFARVTLLTVTCK